MFLEKLILFLSISLGLFLLAQIKITYFASRFSNDNLKQLIKPFSRTNLFLGLLIFFNHIALYLYVYNGHIHQHNLFFYINQSFSSIAGFLLSAVLIIMIANNKILNRKYDYKYKLNMFYNLVALGLFACFCVKLFSGDNEYKTHMTYNHISFLLSIIVASILLIFGFLLIAKEKTKLVVYFSNMNIAIIVFKLMSIFQHNYEQNMDMYLWSYNSVSYLLIAALLFFLMISLADLNHYFSQYKLARNILFTLLILIIGNFIICDMSRDTIKQNIVFGEKITDEIDFNGITRAEGEGYFGTRAEFAKGHKFSYHITNYDLNHDGKQEKPAYFKGIVKDYKITIDKASTRDDYVVTIYEKSFFGSLSFLMNLLFLYLIFIFLACFVKSKKIDG